jgi:hypothetical protein
MEWIYNDKYPNLCNEIGTIVKMKRLWLQAKKMVSEIINHRYVRILFENDFKGKIKWLQDNLRQHRSSNFMGSLLQHHTMKSTKYMSMWIEGEIKINCT